MAIPAFSFDTIFPRYMPSLCFFISIFSQLDAKIMLFDAKIMLVEYIFNTFDLFSGKYRAANYCRTSDNVRLNLANVRAKVILIRHWSDHKKKLSHYTFFAVTKSDCKFTQFAVCKKITRHSSILLNVAPEWLYKLVL